MINKNMFKITNNTKKLIKKGKNWVITSAFALALLGFSGAVVSANSVQQPTNDQPKITAQAKRSVQSNNSAELTTASVPSTSSNIMVQPDIFVGRGGNRGGNDGGNASNSAKQASMPASASTSASLSVSTSVSIAASRAMNPNNIPSITNSEISAMNSEQSSLNSASAAASSANSVSASVSASAASSSAKQASAEEAAGASADDDLNSGIQSAISSNEAKGQTPSNAVKNVSPSLVNSLASSASIAESNDSVINPSASSHSDSNNTPDQPASHRNDSNHIIPNQSNRSSNNNNQSVASSSNSNRNRSASPASSLNNSSSNRPASRRNAKASNSANHVPVKPQHKASSKNVIPNRPNSKLSSKSNRPVKSASSSVNSKHNQPASHSSNFRNISSANHALVKPQHQANPSNVTPASKVPIAPVPSNNHTNAVSAGSSSKNVASSVKSASNQSLAMISNTGNLSGSNYQQSNSASTKVVNYHNVASDAHVDSGIAKAVNQINFNQPAKTVKSDKVLTAIKPGKVIRIGNLLLSKARVPGHFRYFMINRQTLAHLHLDPAVYAKLVKQLKPHHYLTIYINGIYAAHRHHQTYVYYQFNFNHHTLYASADSRYTPNSYFQKNVLTKLYHYVKVNTHCIEYNRPRYSKDAIVRHIKSGSIVRVKKIIYLGRKSNYQTRFVMSNGHYITANKNWVSVVNSNHPIK